MVVVVKKGGGSVGPPLNVVASGDVRVGPHRRRRSYAITARDWALDLVIPSIRRFSSSPPTKFDFLSTLVLAAF